MSLRVLASSTALPPLRVSTATVDLATVTCGLPRSGLTEAHPVRQTWLGLPTAGAFGLHTRGEEHLIHPALGVIFPAGLEYRMTHPFEGGDSGLALMFRADVADEALPARQDRVRVTPIDAGTRYRVGLLLSAMRRLDRLKSEELALALLRTIAAKLARSPSRPPSLSVRRTIDRVRLLLIGEPEARWTVATLARLAGYSPYHFAHQFRACTGTSVHRYLADLRLAGALRRIELGEASLAAVAADLGFAHHSHMTATIRRRLGVTPRVIRKQLAAYPGSDPRGAKSSAAELMQ